MQTLWSREVSRKRCVLVAASLGASCAVAVRRAQALARRFRAALHLVHVLPPHTRTLAANPSVMREVIMRWAYEDAQTRLTEEAVHLESGAAAMQIEEVASRVGADLIVVGASVRQGMGTVLALSAFMARAVLVANHERDGGEIIAATDLRTPGHPVVHCAVRLASAFEREVTLVHNVTPSAARPAVEERERELTTVASGFATIREARLSRVASAAQAVDEVAAKRNADMVIVGVRSGKGHTLAGVLERESSRSVLAVPLPGGLA